MTASSAYPVNLGRLTVDLQTRYGIFPTGTMLAVLEADESAARVCLDTAGHLAGRCHGVTIPATSIEGHRLTKRPKRAGRS